MSPGKRRLIIGVTGTKGFIGGAVREALSADGCEVVRLDGYLSKKRGFSRRHFRKAGRLDWVLHFAAATSIEDSYRDPCGVYENNIVSTLRSLEMAEAAGADFLYMSSYVYGMPRYLPIDEKHPVGVLNPYMGSKLAGEDLSSRLCGHWSKRLVILRGFSIYGDSGKRGRFIAALSAAAKKGRDLVVNDPEAKRDYLYIRDFTALIKKIVRSPGGINGTFNVGYGRSYSNMQAAGLARELSGKRMRIMAGTGRRANDVRDCRADIRLVSKVFSWKPVYTLRMGLSDMLK
jgi:UDP-glucose 4-epimerase